MSILDHPVISQRYFFPREEPVDDPTWVDVPGARLACYARRAGNPVTVVHFHGNGEVVGDYVPELPDLFARLGADCFLAEYRGYGGSTGTPLLGAMLDDIPAIFEAIGRPAHEIVVFGRSVGSIYAIEFASRYPVAGLVLESGIAEPGERLLMRAAPEELGVSRNAFDAEVRARLNHAQKLGQRTLPTLVLHARGDSLVDASHALRLASFPQSNVRLVLFDRGDHNNVFHVNRAQYTEELGELIGLAIGAGSYTDRTTEVAAPADRTLEGGIAVFEDTGEFRAPADETAEFPTSSLARRTGPGQTAVLDIPEGLRRRMGPGDTQENPVYQDDDED